MYNDDEIYNDDQIEQMVAEEEARQKAYEAEEALKPKLLFKYKPISNCIDLERVCGILQNNTIYMPNISELNDPLEGTNAKMLDGNYDGRDKILTQQRILSLSESCFLSTLWAHYAGNYSGICLGYRRTGKFAEAEKIEYVNKQTSWSTDPEISVPSDLYKKGDEWHYEQEWRLICSVKDEKEKYFLEYESKALACVLFGGEMTTFMQNIITKYISPSTAIYTVHPDKQKYCLYAQRNVGGKRIYSIDELLADLSIE